MGKIKKLPDNEIQKIAAGEVVDRPANIVKELIENSLDAGAKNITLYLENGGKDLIRLIDDGCGMSPEDAKMSVVHHATSKISAVDDLEHITTFGFRGEALSSISAISNMLIKTKEAKNELGFELNLNESKILSEKFVSSNIGTEIIIKDLFFNVPARRKFLRTKETELNQIEAIFTAASLSYPTVNFKMVHDGKNIYNLHIAQNLLVRVKQIFDKFLGEHLLEFEKSDSENNIKIHGVISDHRYSRYDRSQIYFFVNKRWVKNFKLGQALVRGYQGVLPDSKYPAAYIFIEIEPSTVDINIHPRKEEVMFIKPRVVENLIEKAIRLTLEKNHQKATMPAMTENKVSPFANSMQISYSSFSSVNSPENTASKQDYSEFINALDLKFSDLKPNEIQGATIENIPFTDQQSIQEKNYKILGISHRTYIILDSADGITFVDQHAAHERILFEKFIMRATGLSQSQKLLMPQILNLPENDVQNMEQNMLILAELGFEISILSKTELAILSLPLDFGKQDAKEILKFFSSIIGDKETFDSSNFSNAVHKKLCAQMACKTAVKAGDILTLAQAEKLIEDLNNTPNKLTCPHGRPTLWNFNLLEIERFFKRKT